MSKILLRFILLSIVTILAACSQTQHLPQRSVEKQQRDFANLVESFRSSYENEVLHNARLEQLDKEESNRKPIKTAFYLLKIFNFDLNTIWRYDPNLAKLVQSIRKKYASNGQLENLEQIDPTDKDLQNLIVLLVPGIRETFKKPPTSQGSVIQPLGYARVRVRGRIIPPTPGSQVVLTYKTSTSCVWWFIDRVDKATVESNGYYSISRNYSAWWFCQPQLLNGKIKWIADPNYPDALYTLPRKIFSWKQGGTLDIHYDLRPFDQTSVRPLGGTQIKGGRARILAANVVQQHNDLDKPAQLYVLVFRSSDVHSLKCVISWGDGTIEEKNCYSSQAGTYNFGPFMHKYMQQGNYDIQIRLKNNSLVSSNAYKLKLTTQDHWKVNLRSIDNVFPYQGSLYKFGYRIEDPEGIYEQPYRCRFIVEYGSSTSALQTLLETAWRTCQLSGESPEFRLDVPLGHPEDPTTLDLEVEVLNNRNELRSARLRITMLPPVEARIHHFDATPKILNGEGDVTINFAADTGSTFLGTRINCEIFMELPTEKLRIYSSTGLGCTGSITRRLVNHYNSTSVTYNFTMRAWADTTIDGTPYHSETSASTSVTVNPALAHVDGECRVQSRAGGNYDRVVSCSISPIGDLSPGEYTFTASSAYVCPAIRKTIYAGEDYHLVFNCHR